MKTKLTNPVFDINKVSILVVDDHAQMRKSIRRILSEIGFQLIHESGNGSEAIRILKETPIDMVICDLYLQDVNGFDILEHCRNRELNYDIPFLVVTGEASKEEIIKASDRGASDYLLKPFTTSDLEIKVVGLLNAFFKPEGVQHFLRQASRLLMERQIDPAVQLVEKALKIEPTSILARHLRALILETQGQYGAALQLHMKNISDNSLYFRAYAGLAEIYIKQRNFEAAIDAMKKELEINARQTRRQTQVGSLLLDLQRIDEAINHFREALKENVKFLPALFAMGKAFAAKGDLEKAIYYFKRIRRYYPTNTKCLEAVVKFCLDAADPKKAEFLLKDEKNAHKNRLDTYIVLAKLYLAINEKDKSLSSVDELLILDPNNIPGLKTKASIHLKFGEIPEASTIYQRILSTDVDVETIMQYSDVLILSQNYKEALVQLQRVLPQKCKDASFMHKAAFCHLSLGEIRKARILIEKLQMIETNLSDVSKKLILDIKRAFQSSHPSAIVTRAAS